jgi:uncharacterized protein involved in exopolysaccharide biosynthesis
MRSLLRRARDAEQDRRRKAAQLVSWYIGRAPAPYTAPLSKTALVLLWVLCIGIFLGVLVLMAWASSMG